VFTCIHGVNELHTNEAAQRMYHSLNSSCFHDILVCDNIEVINHERMKQLLHEQHNNIIGHRKICPSLTHRALTIVTVNNDSTGATATGAGATNLIHTAIYISDEHVKSFKQMGEVLLHEMIHLYDIQSYSPLLLSASTEGTTTTTASPNTQHDIHQHIGGHDGHTTHFHQIATQLEHILKADGSTITRISRPSTGTGSIVPKGISKEVFAELLSNMLTELTLEEKRAYQRTVKTGNIVKDLQQAGIEQEKIDIITYPLTHPETAEIESQQNQQM